MTFATILLFLTNLGTTIAGAVAGITLIKMIVDWIESMKK